MNAEDYSIGEHIHRYACRTAARAASISRFSNTEINDFIQSTGLRTALLQLKEKPEVALIYKDWFIEQVEQIKQQMEQYKSKQPEHFFRNVSFGIAAKIVSIYIKTAEVIPSAGTSPVACCAFPPIDSYLLKGLKIKSKAWSGLEKEPYMLLLDEVIKKSKGKPYWTIEYYWNLNAT